jgi:hypothetical protein
MVITPEVTKERDEIQCNHEILQKEVKEHSNEF